MRIPIFILGLVVSGVCILLVIWNVDLNLLWHSLAQASWQWVAASAAASVMQLIWRSLRWRRILRPVAEVPPRATLRSYMIGQTANVLLPFRTGELIRVLVLGRLKPVSKTASLASVVSERILDLYTMLALLGITVIMIPLPSWATTSAWSITTLAVSATVILATMKKYQRFYARTIQKLDKLLPERFSGRLSGQIDSFVSGLQGLGSAGQYLGLLMDTVVIWLLAGSVIYFLFMAFSLTTTYDLGVIAVLVVVMMTALSVSVPSSPGFVGTMHLAIVVGLGLFEVPKEVALGYAVILHAVSMTVTVTMGLLSLRGDLVSIRSIFKR